MTPPPLPEYSSLRIQQQPFKRLIQPAAICELRNADFAVSRLRNRLNKPAETPNKKYVLNG